MTTSKSTVQFKPRQKFYEFDQQKAFFDWTQLSSIKERYPILSSPLCFAVPNGGSRHKAEAYRLKQTGVKAGVFDILILAARGGYHGLCIEFKADKTKCLSDKQVAFKALAESEGYLCVMHYDWQFITQMVGRYLDGKEIKV